MNIDLDIIYNLKTTQLHLPHQFLITQRLHGSACLGMVADIFVHCVLRHFFPLLV